MSESVLILSRKNYLAAIGKLDGMDTTNLNGCQECGAASVDWHNNIEHIKYTGASAQGHSKYNNDNVCPWTSDNQSSFVLLVRMVKATEERMGREVLATG